MSAPLCSLRKVNLVVVLRPSESDFTQRLARAGLTMNAPNMTREALQTLMRHQSPLTTQLYINMSQQLNPAVANLHMPEVLRKA